MVLIILVYKMFLTMTKDLILDNKVTLQSPFCNTTDSIYIDKTSNIVLPKTAKFFTINI
ncbi:MAG: hypothetical protein ACLRR3_00855 [Eubacterium sp.]